MQSLMKRGLVQPTQALKNCLQASKEKSKATGRFMLDLEYCLWRYYGDQPTEEMLDQIA